MWVFGYRESCGVTTRVEWAMVPTRGQTVICVYIFCSHIPTTSFTLFTMVHFTWTSRAVDIDVWLLPAAYRIHIDEVPV